MKSNELRIGNYVMFFKDTPSKVIGFANGQLYIHYNDEKYFITDLDDASPIPLTEEWLLKFGFEKKEYEKSQYKEYEYILDNFKYFRDRFWIVRCEECGRYADVKYVHELQNLYFALTKEELTMK